MNIGVVMIAKLTSTFLLVISVKRSNLSCNLSVFGHTLSLTTHQLPFANLSTSTIKDGGRKR